jgi:hypothetical protein
MTYRPTKATFLVPLGTRLPWLYETVVVGDRYRVVGVSTVTLFMFISALASVIRQNMAGVILHPDGIELREVLPLGVPRFKRFTWSQIDRVFIPEPKATPAPPKAGEPRRTKIQLHLWNGTQAFLPTVAKHVDLSVMLERVALARAIPIEGGTGLIDDLGNPFGDGEDD